MCAALDTGGLEDTAHICMLQSLELYPKDCTALLQNSLQHNTARPGHFAQLYRSSCTALSGSSIG